MDVAYILKDIPEWYCLILRTLLVAQLPKRLAITTPEWLFSVEWL